MKNLLSIGILLLFISCKTVKNNSIENNHKQILVIENGKSKNIIFQSQYAKDFFKEDSSQYVFFDIDKESLKYINDNLNSEYCKVSNKSMSDAYDMFIATSKEYNNKEDVERFEKAKIEALEDCETLSKEIEYYDRQLIGGNNVYGKKVIRIQLLDFRNDPSNIKQDFETGFIIGYHGWFESNTRFIIFLVDEKRFVMSSDAE